jgi:hypothetical protein
MQRHDLVTYLYTAVIVKLLNEVLVLKLCGMQAAAVAMRNAETQRRHQQLISSKEAVSQARGLRQSRILEKVCMRAPLACGPFE